MTRQQIRNLVTTITGRECPPDDQEVVLTSLQQLEFIFAFEDLVDGVNIEDIPSNWKCVNDVVVWLEEKGEFDG